jgi:hypothetical protein
MKRNRELYQDVYKLVGFPLSDDGDWKYVKLKEIILVLSFYDKTESCMRVQNTYRMKKGMKV